MNFRHAGCAAAILAAALSVPAFAQTAAPVTSSNVTTVTTGTPGLVVTQGVPGMTPTTVLVPGAATVIHGPAQVTTVGNTTTTVQQYWVNVPADVVAYGGFQRWQRLR
jgi:hypothetical protein